MQKRLLDLIQCPVCKGEQYTLEIEEENALEIRAGIVTCLICHNSFSIENGILDLLVNPSQEIINEQTGWTRLEKSVINTDELMLSLPDGIGEHRTAWQAQGNNFHFMWSNIQLSGTETVLDLGAGRCWATRYFASKGCQVVGLDILMTRYVGLLTSDIYFENEGVYFDRICCDMNQIPLRKSVFDIVFLAATLHHSSDILRTIKQIHAVLKPGGRLIIINEPVTGFFASKQLNCPEVEHGINEHAYRLLEYTFALRRSKLSFQIFPFIGSYSDLVHKLNHQLVKTFPNQLMPKRVWPPLLKAQLLFYGGMLNLIAQKQGKSD